MEVIVIGAGPSGLIASRELSSKGYRVSLIEKNNKIGRKLLTTGSGTCNFTNMGVSPERYHGENEKFVYSTLSEYGPEDIIAYFEDQGIMTIKKEDGRCYPRTLEARTFTNFFEAEMERQKVDLILGEKVVNISYDGGFKVDTDKNTYRSDILLIASGGKTYKNLGSDGSIFPLIEGLGHRITKFSPAICQISLYWDDFKKVKGTRFFSNLSLYEEDKLKKSYYNEILFTDYGISGPAVLQLSSYALDILRNGKDAYFSIDFLSDYSKEELVNLFSYEFYKELKFTLRTNLSGKLKIGLVEMLFDEKLLDRYTNTISMKEMNFIIDRLKDYRLKIKGYLDFDKAQVTRGGVDTREVDPKTLESKLIKNLYFAGEVLDVDGDCGGFNLHFAFSSGLKAAKAILGE